MTLSLVQIFSLIIIHYPDIKVVLSEVFYKKHIFINPKISECFKAPDNQILIFMNNMGLWGLIFMLSLICQDTLYT